MLSLLLQADSSTGDGDVSDGTSYFGVERHVWAWGIGTGFALSALLISGALLIQTWRLNPLPLIRRWVLLVLLMVPIYSVFAWLGLVLKNQSAYWDLVRECYEAVALWAFFEFLTAYLGGGQHMAGVLEKKPDYHHIIPFCCLPTWKMHRQFYTNTRFWVIQYIPVQVVCSIVIFITSLTGQYHEGHFAANDVYIYTAFAINCSQIMALYALVLFYQALKVELAPCRPFSKFLCIKLVVFFTFWQSVFLSMLVAVGAIEPTVTYNTNQESYGIDDFIICIEMLFFAIGHWYAFPPREFEGYRPAAEVLAISKEEGARTEIPADAQDEWSYNLASERGGHTSRVQGRKEAAPAPDDAPPVPARTDAPPAYTRQPADIEMGRMQGSTAVSGRGADGDETKEAGPPPPIPPRPPAKSESELELTEV